MCRMSSGLWTIPTITCLCCMYMEFVTCLTIVCVFVWKRLILHIFKKTGAHQVFNANNCIIFIWQVLWSNNVYVTTQRDMDVSIDTSPLSVVMNTSVIQSMSTKNSFRAIWNIIYILCTGPVVWIVYLFFMAHTRPMSCEECFCVGHLIQYEEITC
jgi:hypothetical protein